MTRQVRRTRVGLLGPRGPRPLGRPDRAVSHLASRRRVWRV